MKIKICFVLALFIFSCRRKENSSFDNIKSGKKIFNKSCRPCHDLNILMIGPPLASLSDSSFKFIKRFKQTKECHNDSLTNEDLRDIIDYIQNNKVNVDY